MHSCESSRRRLRLLTVAELHWKNGHEYALVGGELLKSQGIDFVVEICGLMVPSWRPLHFAFGMNWSWIRMLKLFRRVMLQIRITMNGPTCI